MATNTIRLYRVLRTTPEKRYRAFLDADAMAKWLPPNGFTGKVHHLEAKVGGTYKMSFTNFTTGHSLAFGGKFLELAPHETIRYSDQFDDPNLPGEIQVTVTLKKVSVGDIDSPDPVIFNRVPRNEIWITKSHPLFLFRNVDAARLFLSEF